LARVAHFHLTHRITETCNDTAPCSWRGANVSFDERARWIGAQLYAWWLVAGGCAASAEDTNGICPAIDFRGHFVAKGLDAIANALNRGDFAAAMIAAVHTLTPEMSPEAALRLANAEQELIKYNYNPYEPRDSHGRWTTDGVVGQANVGSPGIVSDQAVDVRVFDQRRVPDDPSSTDSALLSGGGDGSEGPTPLKQPVEGNYDNLGSVQVTMVDDIMRSIVKNACIAECSESSLPTHNYGWKFFNCANDCLRRHGTTHLPSVRSRGGWMEWRTGCQRTQPRS
jgi:hypothetical protein